MFIFRSQFSNDDSMEWEEIVESNNIVNKVSKNKKNRLLCIYFAINTF